MKRKGFGEKDFASVHPKGALGKRLLRIETLMHKGRAVPRVKPGDRMNAVVEEMTAKKLGMTCVVDAPDGWPRHHRRRLAPVYSQTPERLLAKTAGECMTTGPVTVRRTDLAAEALNIMEQNRITSLVVLGAGSGGRDHHLHNLWRTEMF
jgi:arabinose-5-phosphate isomerase